MAFGAKWWGWGVQDARQQLVNEIRNINVIQSSEKRVNNAKLTDTLRTLQLAIDCGTFCFCTIMSYAGQGNK